MHKNRTSYTDGFKAHVAVEPDTGLIVAAALTAGNAPDGPTGVALLAGEHDPARGAGRLRLRLAATPAPRSTSAGHTQFIKPMPLRPATDAPDAFTIDDFDIDTTAGTVACPGGHTVTITAEGTATFGRRCTHCPLQARCTRAKQGKKLKIHPTPRPARRRPPRRDRRRLAGHLPPTPPHGRTHHRLAGRPRPPAGPLPRHRPPTGSGSPTGPPP